MEDRKKRIQEIEELAKQTTDIADKFSSFVGVMTKDLSESDKKKLDKAMKSVKIEDLSPTIAKMNADLKNFQNKYSL